MFTCLRIRARHDQATQSDPAPCVLLKKASAPLTSPSRPAARHRMPVSHRCETHRDATSLPRQEHSPSRATGDAKGHLKHICQRPWLPPGAPIPAHSMEMGQRDEGRLGRCRSQPGPWEWKRRGASSWEQLLLQLVRAAGTEQGLQGLGSYRSETHAITSPLSRGKEAPVFILCRKMLVFNC